MSAAKLVRSSLARQDLSDIYQHLAWEAGMDLADSVLTRITEAPRRVADQPLIHARGTEHFGAPRRVNVFRYAIFSKPVLVLGAIIAPAIRRMWNGL